MGVKGPGERATICQEGCAMTSVSMALAGLGAKLHGDAVRPDTMNQWLEENKGYTCIDGDCNNLVLAAPGSVPGSPLTFVSEKPKPALSDMRDAVLGGSTVIIGETPPVRTPEQAFARHGALVLGIVAERISRTRIPRHPQLMCTTAATLCS